MSPNKFHCHNFSILYIWNERVRTLFVDWILRQLQYGVSKDGQITLCQALACAGQKYGLKYGQISPNWSFAFLSLRWGKNGEWWKHRTTRVISGPAEICHNGAICNDKWVGDDPKLKEPHVFYFMVGNTSVTGLPMRPVYSQGDINGILPY